MSNKENNVEVNMGINGGTEFKKTMEELTQAIILMKGEIKLFSNSLTGLNQEMNTMLSGFSQYTKAAAESAKGTAEAAEKSNGFKEKAKEVAQALKEISGEKIAQGLQKTGESMVLYGAKAEEAGKAVKESGLMELKQGFAQIGESFSNMVNALAEGPIGKIINHITSLGTEIVKLAADIKSSIEERLIALGKIAENIKEKFISFASSVAEAIGKAGAFIEGMVKKAGALGLALLELASKNSVLMKLKEGFEYISGGFSTLFKTIAGGAVEKISSVVGKLGEGISKLGIDIGNHNLGEKFSVFSKIGDMVTAAKEKFGGLANGIADGVKKAIPFLQDMGKKALELGSALVNSTVESAKFAEDLLTQSSSTKISTENLQQYGYACNALGMDMGTLTSSMSENMKSMENAKDDTSKAAQAYSELGISLKNADGTLKDSNEVYWETIDALNQIENEAEKDALAMELLGNSGTKLNGIMESGSQAFKDLGEEAYNMGAVMGGDQIEALGRFQENMDKLTIGTKGFKDAAGLIALPFLDVLSTQGVEILGAFSKGIQESNGDIGEMANVAGTTAVMLSEAITQQLPILMEMGTQLLNGLVTGISENLPIIITAANDILISMIDALISFLPLIIESAFQIVQSIAQGISDALPELIPKIADLLGTIVETLLQNLPLLIDAALQLITGLAEGLIAALPVLISYIPGIIVAIVDALIQSIPMIIQAGVDLLVALIDNLPAIIEGIIVAIPQIIGGIVTAVLENLPALIAAGVSLFVALIGSLPEIIIAVAGAVPQIIDSVVSAIGGQFENIKQAGYNLLTGLWEGMNNAKEWLVSKVKSLLGSVVDSIKDFFGIRSPSRLFAYFGEMNMEGLALGMERMKGRVDGAADRVFGNLGRNLDAGFNFNGNSMGALAGGYSEKVELILQIENYNSYTGADEQALGETLATAVNRRLYGRGGR